MANKFKIAIKYLYEGILENLFFTSETCILCNEYSYEPYICNKCLAKISLCESNYYINKDDYNIACSSLAYYAYPIKDIILALKFKNNPMYAKILVYIFDKYVKIDWELVDYITYVPMTKKDKVKRGYNQSELLAKHLSDAHNITMMDALMKFKSTEEQVGLNRNERFNNIKGVFKLSLDKNFIKDKRIVIVDDVITTGATSFYCSKELLDNGAKSVEICTIAKSGNKSTITI